MSLLYPLVRSILFKLDPEKSHDLTLKWMRRIANSPFKFLIQQNMIKDPVTVFGVEFPNKVGLAAGLDKNGICIDAFAALGFGHIEVGTVTPRPQPGNPKPRLFRIPSKEGIVNR
ncbi:MAG: quinone-dependent dihydroorotate dehydrogenase, partial [Kangiellaceae bacterium]|nr:quinone-dependent dihydroorotate dehydrogenase [Kangiellaceae bacterium]